jgi:hypothetical protein
MKLKLFLLSILSVVGLMLPISAQAGALSVRLGQPKSPTNQNNFKLTFVALEIDGTDNISVGCYKKSPSDSDYVKFEDLTLDSGGDTAYCSVDSNILSTGGTYYFKVIANGVVASNIATVDFNTSYPGTPVSYSKEKINNCDYKIKFKTADDGRTTKVELYRSDTTSMSINSEHLISTQTISPNTEGEFVNSVPTCGKEYYFAIRAVDNSDNVSGITGDSFTTTTISGTTTTTSTNSQSAIPTANSQVSGEGENQEGVSPTVNPSETVTPENSSTSAVLGAQTSKLSYLKWLALPLLVAAIYFFMKAKKRS